MAKRYTFRLGTVLKLRRQAEQECRRQVAARLREIARVQAELEQLGEQFDWEIRRSRDDQQNPDLDVLTVRRRRTYMTFLQRGQRESQTQLGLLQTQLDQDHKALAQASKEVKVMEKLRERQWTRHQDRERRAEQAETDEIGGQMFLRRQPVTAE